MSTRLSSSGGLAATFYGDEYIMDFQSLLKILPGLLLLALSTAPAAFAAGECGVLDGIEHCAVGEASLQCEEGLCVIDNLDGAPNAGVSAHFSEGLSWSSELRIDESKAENTTVQALAFSEGGVASTFTVRRNEEGSLALSSTFTGAPADRTYSVMVFNGGVFQGGAGGIGDGAEYLYIDNRWDEDFIMWLISMMGFTQRVHDGGCGWVLDLSELREVRLANGEVLRGDQIQFMEEVKGEGHYAYTGFDGIDLVGNFESITLESATVLP